MLLLTTAGCASNDRGLIWSFGEKSGSVPNAMKWTFGRVPIATFSRKTLDLAAPDRALIFFVRPSLLADSA
jgi:hypothetical protein